MKRRVRSTTYRYIRTSQLIHPPHFFISHPFSSVPVFFSFFPCQAKSGASSPPVPVYAVVTNCTYDGLSIDCHKAERLLGDVVDRLHFDEVRG